MTASPFKANFGLRILAGVAALGTIVYATTTGININNGAAVFADNGAASIGPASSDAIWHRITGHIHFGTGTLPDTNSPTVRVIGSKESSVRWNASSINVMGGVYLNSSAALVYSTANCPGAQLIIARGTAGSLAANALALYVDQSVSHAAGDPYGTENLAMSCTHAGAFGFGIATASATTNHNFHGNSITLNGNSLTSPYINIQYSATVYDYWQLDHANTAAYGVDACIFRVRGNSGSEVLASATNAAGAWTWPANTNHVFGNATDNASCSVGIKTKDNTKSAQIVFYQGATDKGYIGVTHLNNLINGAPAGSMCVAGWNTTPLYFSGDGATAVHGICATTGAWTFPTCTTHTFGSASVANGTTTLVIAAGTTSADANLTLSTAGSAGRTIGITFSSANNYNWKIIANNTSSDILEFFTSTAAGGSTFTVPVLTLTASNTVKINSLAGAGSRAVNADANGVLSAASDSRLKNPVQCKLPGLAEVLQLSVEAYQWKSEIERIGDSAAVEIGYYADKVALIIPSAAPMCQNGYYGLYDRSISAAHTNAIKELAAENDTLKSRIAELERRIAA